MVCHLLPFAKVGQYMAYNLKSFILKFPQYPVNVVQKDMQSFWKGILNMIFEMV